MVRFIIFLCFLLSNTLAYSQSSFTGQWKAKIVGIDMYININENLLLTIPVQGILDKKATNFEVSDNKIDFYYQAYAATFVGQLTNDTIVGLWKQAGQTHDVSFVRTEEVIEINRSQEPLAEINYVSEDVKFESSGEDKYLMAGTITKPQGEGPFPAIVLVSGSGPQNRNSEFFNHRPFLILADYFTRNGYLVLRYDDRGIGESKGYFAKVTTKDLADDTNGAIEFLNERSDVDVSKLGIMGHSEGGMIAPIVASQNPHVDYIVLIAGPGVPVRNLMEYQLNHQYELLEGLSKEGLASGKEFNKKMIDLVIQDKPNDKIVDELRQLTSKFYYDLTKEEQKLLAPSEQRFYFQIAPSMMNQYMKYFLAFEPHDYLIQVKVPTLAINGKKDIQVRWKDNIQGIEDAFEESGQEKMLTTKTYKNLNHLFQTSKTGEGDEYFINEETFNQKAMEDILNWLNKL